MDVQGGRVSRDQAYLAVVMRFYPRFLKKEKVDEYIPALAPPKELFTEFKAKDRKLTPEEMEGGTFTITNLGGIGGTGFSPIVNHPEVAILGLSRSRMEPEWVNKKFEPRLILPLSLSYDHRLIDGADAARFLRWIAEAFEQPFLLSVQG